MRRVIVAVLAVIGLVFIAGCEGDQGGAAEKERDLRDGAFEKLQSQQPARGMDFSPTRENINFWADTWEQPGKLSYVYLMASNGQLVGYYIFEGLPISYCASLFPNYDFVDSPDDGDYDWDFQVPAPSVDGVYYSGGQCSQYFGKDATTGSYLEFSAGNGINFLVYEEPLPRQDVEPLGFTEVNEVDKQ